MIPPARPASTPPPAPRFAALHTRDYRRYFALSLTAMTADNIEHVISYWVIYQAFHSPMLAGFAVISHWMPFLLFSVYSGALADRYDCRKLIQAGQILFMVASLSWGLLFLTGTLRMWHAVVILLLHGAAGVTVGARHAAHPPRHGRARAASERDPSERHGPLPRHPAGAGRRRWAHAAARARRGGSSPTCLIYAPFSIFLWTIPYTGHLRDGVVARPAARLGSGDALRVFGEVRGDRRIVVMIVLGGVTSFFVGNAFQAQMPEYAHHLGTDEAGGWYSLLLAANATGAILGTVLLESSNVLRPSVRSAIACAGVWGLAIGLFPAAPNYPVAVTLLVIAGAFNIAFASMAQTLVQLLAPPRVRGAVVGLFNTAMLGLRAGSGLTVGVLGALISVQWSLALSAMVVVASAARCGHCAPQVAHDPHSPAGIQTSIDLALHRLALAADRCRPWRAVPARV